jgi:hypothetical protein
VICSSGTLAFRCRSNILEHLPSRNAARIHQQAHQRQTEDWHIHNAGVRVGLIAERRHPELTGARLCRTKPSTKAPPTDAIAQQFPVQTGPSKSNALCVLSGQAQWNCCSDRFWRKEQKISVPSCSKLIVRNTIGIGLVQILHSRLLDNFELQPCQQCRESNRAEEKTSAKHKRVGACANGGGQVFADTVMLRQ